MFKNERKAVVLEAGGTHSRRKETKFYHINYEKTAPDIFPTENGRTFRQE